MLINEFDRLTQSGADGKTVLSVGDTDAQDTLEEACYCMNIGHFKSLQNLLMYENWILQKPTNLTEYEYWILQNLQTRTRTC